MLEQNDWRLTNQEKYLLNARLQKKAYVQPTLTWDHDHCEFCWAKFMEGTHNDVLHEGYCTENEKCWICEQCYQDFKDTFNFRVED